MKAKMEEAAKGLDKLAQHLLPERPHHLTAFDEIRRRYPSPSGFWFTGASGPLQYMTYVCDAGRGVLLTRPRYELCDEPEVTPAPKPLKAPPKGDFVKKKIPFQEYHQRKKSVSPADNEGVVKMEPKQNGATESKTIKENGERLKKELVKPRESSGLRQEIRPEKIHQDLNGNRHMATQQKQESHPTSGENRKRPADHDENTPPPQKRPRADVSAPRITIPKPETPRARDRPPEKEKPVPKEAKGGLLHPQVNGHIGHERDREQTASPKSTIQVNGSTPRKSEPSSRSHVPELLSPLHPSVERELTGRDRQKKRPAEKAPMKLVKVEEPSPAKKQKTWTKIPALLSPTLPPVVELELARLKKTPSKGESSRSSQASDSPNSTRKTKITTEPSDETEGMGDGEPKKILIVVLKLRKAMAKRAKELLSLPSKSAKEALKKERSMSIEGTPPPARKRPRPPEDDTVGHKKHRSDSISARPAAPSTPLKHTATAMSRVTSSQSQSNTPGTGAGLTPGTAERPPTSSNDTDYLKNRAQIEALREHMEKHQGLGRNLKHSRDDLLKTRGSAITPAEEKRAAALHFEMILAYMLSFSAFNKCRSAERKVLDIERWDSLMPHFRELRGRVRHSRPLAALAVQMHAVCLEEITHAYVTYDQQAATNLLRRWRDLERSRASTWAEAMSISKEIDRSEMKTVIGPWTSVEDAVSEALAIMGRWAERERVNWRPIINQKSQTNGVKS